MQKPTSEDRAAGIRKCLKLTVLPCLEVLALDWPRAVLMLTLKAEQATINAVNPLVKNRRDRLLWFPQICPQERVLTFFFFIRLSHLLQAPSLCSPPHHNPPFTPLLDASEYLFSFVIYLLTSHPPSSPILSKSCNAAWFSAFIAPYFFSFVNSALVQLSWRITSLGPGLSAVMPLSAYHQYLKKKKVKLKC